VQKAEQIEFLRDFLDAQLARQEGVKDLVKAGLATKADDVAMSAITAEGGMIRRLAEIEPGLIDEKAFANVERYFAKRTGLKNSMQGLASAAEDAGSSVLANDEGADRRDHRSDGHPARRHDRRVV